VNAGHPERALLREGSAFSAPWQNFAAAYCNPQWAARGISLWRRPVLNVAYFCDMNLACAAERPQFRPSTITADFAIRATATPRARTVTVTTAAGTSNTQLFTVE